MLIQYYTTQQELVVETPHQAAFKQIKGHATWQKPIYYWY
jgi:hypothetical protein